MEDAQRLWAHGAVRAGQLPLLFSQAKSSGSLTGRAQEHARSPVIVFSRPVRGPRRASETQERGESSRRMLESRPRKRYRVRASQKSKNISTHTGSANRFAPTIKHTLVILLPTTHANTAASPPKTHPSPQASVRSWPPAPWPAPSPLASPLLSFHRARVAAVSTVLACYLSRPTLGACSLAGWPPALGSAGLRLPRDFASGLSCAFIFFSGVSLVRRLLV